MRQMLRTRRMRQTRRAERKEGRPMCYAGNCHPDCDGCKPKYVFCPECGLRAPLKIKACLSCGHEFTEAERDDAVEKWKKSHIGRW